MNSGTRILIIGINYAPELTGIGRYSGDMGAWLSKQGADVQVITGFPYYPEWKVRSGYRPGWYGRERISGAKVLRCPMYVPIRPTSVRRMLQDLTFMVTSWLAVTYLRFRGSRFDEIWVASPSFLSGWVGLWAGWLNSGARRSLHVFDLQVDAAGALGMIRGGWLLRILTRVESAMMKRFDRVSTLSEGMRERIIQKGIAADSTMLLPIWVDTVRFQPGVADTELLFRLGLPTDRHIVLYSGAVGEKQGLEHVLTMAGLAKAGGMRELLFVITGDGPYMRILKMTANDLGLDNVLFRPLQRDDDFPALLNAASLHLVLQRHTAGDHFMPSKLFPILSSGGLAMVTAAAESSLGKLIFTHDIAELVLVNDPSVLFRHMIDLLRSPADCQRYRTNARQFVEENLSRERVLSNYWLIEK
jgi:colanic acid biosynthesis glycosyl transferase WcaI